MILKEESMVFVYESEAAALFTQYDNIYIKESFIPFCYLLVDCGGGTVDIAAHKITKQHGNIVFENLVPPHGSNCGGFAVNDQFENLMKRILNLSSEKYEQLKTNCAVQWTLLMNRHFEEKKIILDPKNSMPMYLILPRKINKEIKNLTDKSLEELIADYGDENIEWDEEDSSIILNCSAVDKLFDPVLDEVCELIKSVLAKQECGEIKTILLVGGFAGSPHLFTRINDSFGRNYKVQRSSTAIYSVVKGAVLCCQQESLRKLISENQYTIPATATIDS